MILIIFILFILPINHKNFHNFFLICCHFSLMHIFFTHFHLKFTFFNSLKSTFIDKINKYIYIYIYINDSNKGVETRLSYKYQST